MPQDTVLGPLLFSLYINDIMVGIESEIHLFTDDCVCYRQIDSTEAELSLGFQKQEFRTPILQKVGVPLEKVGVPSRKVGVPQSQAFHSEW